jgi:hypothetical protein
MAAADGQAARVVVGVERRANQTAAKARVTSRLADWQGKRPMRLDQWADDGRPAMWWSRRRPIASRTPAAKETARKPAAGISDRCRTPRANGAKPQAAVTNAAIASNAGRRSRNRTAWAAKTAVIAPATGNIALGCVTEAASSTAARHTEKVVTGGPTSAARRPPRRPAAAATAPNATKYGR